MTTTTSITILIVEDDPDYLGLLEKVLHKAGYQTHHADNLRDALGLFYSVQPDLVIVDIMLHGKRDGIAFARKINENEATKSPFIFLTSSFDREIFEEAKLTMPYSYLLKPFNPLELHYTLELALEKFAGESGLLDNGNLISGRDCFFIKTGEAMEKLMINEIQYVGVEGRYCELWTTARKYVVQSSMKDLLTQMAPAVFLRIHRNYAVNFEQVDAILAKDGQVQLKGGKQLPLSRRYLEEIKKNFTILL